MTVSYTDPTAGDDTAAIQDGLGNDAVSFSGLEILNTSTQLDPDFEPPDGHDILL